MDFGIFGLTPGQVQDLRNLMQNQMQQAQGGLQNGVGAGGNGNGNANGGGDQQQGGGSGDGNAQGERVLMHNLPHQGVVCDICNTEIRGFRYKCMQCPDYDLCSKCEQNGHHAGHIMMRVAFPEQTRDAIRRYLSNANNSCPPSPPTAPRGPHHGHGHGPRHHGHGEEFPFGRGSCRRSAPGPSSGDESAAPGAAAGCPYTMGRKEFKKWSKWMKRAAAHQHRSAVAYARAAAASGNETAPGAAAGAEAGPEMPPMDFAAVASQIQEFLNYWGIPVDVVELYDQFGNRGQPTSAPTTPGTANAETTTQQNESASTTTQTQPNAEAAATGTEDQQPASPAANLSDNMEQMRINESQNNASAPAPNNEMSLLMDLDTDNNDWTILDNSREQTPGNSNANAESQQQPAETVSAPPAAEGSLNSNNGNSTPFASVGSNASSGSSTTPTAPVAPAPTFPSGVPNVPLYPVLNQPQIQQILQGVSSAVNSVVRSIPIVTDPRGPMGTNVTNSGGGQVPSTGASAPPASGGNTGSIELDARSMRTLNQLLAMGFSNEEGYLSRLVVAKNGDLEAILSSLFPN